MQCVAERDRSNEFVEVEVNRMACVRGTRDRRRPPDADNVAWLQDSIVQREELDLGGRKFMRG